MNDIGRDLPYQTRCLQPVADLPGVGPKFAERLGRKGIASIEDLLLTLPLRYDDRRVISPIAALRAGESATVCATVERAQNLGGRGRLRRTIARVADDSGSIEVVWFGFAGMNVQKGDRLAFSGPVGERDGRLQMQNPDAEPVGPDEPRPMVLPVYSETEGMGQRTWRKLIGAALDRHADGWIGALPAATRRRLGLLPLDEALRQLHRPSAEPEAAPAALLELASSPLRSLILEEMFAFQVAMTLRRRLLGEADGPAVDASDDAIGPVRAALPFALTPGQDECWRAIAGDLQSGRPMHRLLHGDVGSGKTVLALLAAFAAARSGWQTAVMAPTEILAEQHARRFAEVLEPLGVRTALFTGGLATRERRRLQDRIALGLAAVVLGTHALLAGDIEFHRLGLAIVDEQHKFGVAQRASLAAKGGQPHLLVMTATPIPRSLALTLYGDLDISLLREGPRVGKAIATRLVAHAARDAAYRDFAAELRRGRQGYVVCPRLDRAADDKRNVVELFAELRDGPLREFRLAMLHGQTSGGERTRIITEFSRGALDAIVATSVVEVGLDAPNAGVLAVENAESFGLSQLHQMRGRIGRDGRPALCLLLTGGDCPPASRERLSCLETHDDGFAIAELDLQLRGPGELLGQRQSGLPSLRFAKWALADASLLAAARKEAAAVVSADPTLSRPEHEWTKMTVLQRWGALLGEGGAG
jgi:ATP-dependent DNA helicase RecG